MYHFRNLPCNILPDDKLWCVNGRHRTENIYGGGVLEWCYDEADAKCLLEQMLKDPTFNNLWIGKYKP